MKNWISAPIQKGLLILNSVGQTVQFVSYMFFSKEMFEWYSDNRPIPPIAIAFAKFLGGFNISFALLALLFLNSKKKVTEKVFLVFGVGSSSQVFAELVALNSGIVYRSHAYQIMCVDGAFALINIAAFIVLHFQRVSRKRIDSDPHS